MIVLVRHFYDSKNSDVQRRQTFSLESLSLLSDQLTLVACGGKGFSFPGAWTNVKTLKRTSVDIGDKKGVRPFLRDVLDTGREYCKDASDFVVYLNDDCCVERPMIDRLNAMDDSVDMVCIQRDDIHGELSSLNDVLSSTQRVPFYDFGAIDGVAFRAGAYDRLRGKIPDFILGACRWDNYLLRMPLYVPGIRFEVIRGILHPVHASGWGGTPADQWNIYEMRKNMRTVLISPFSKILATRRANPKNYPYWSQVVHDLQLLGYYVIQIGEAGEPFIGADEVSFNLPFIELTRLVKESTVWASVDNFLPHFCHSCGLKPGVVVFTQSDPEIFGYCTNRNLLVDRSFLRPDQYGVWEDSPGIDGRSFVPVPTVVRAIEETAAGHGLPQSSAELYAMPKKLTVEHSVKDDRPKEYTVCVLTYGPYAYLAKNCLNSIIQFMPPESYQLRVWMNEVCPETRKFVKQVASGHSDMLVYDSPENVRKSRAMHELYWNEEHPLQSKYIMWFDDDAVITDPSFFRALCSAVARGDRENVAHYGHPYFFPKYGKLADFLRQWISEAKWYTGKPIPDKIDFATGGWTLSRVDALKKIGWPDSRLILANPKAPPNLGLSEHGQDGNRDDVLLNEALRQQGYGFQPFTFGTRVQTAPIRGVR